MCLGICPGLFLNLFFRNVISYMTNICVCVCFGSINNPLKVVNTLRVLNDAGVLDMQETDRKLRRTLEEAACDHCGAIAPYL